MAATRLSPNRSRSRANRSSGIAGAAMVRRRANWSGSRSASGQRAGSPVSDFAAAASPPARSRSASAYASE